MVLIVCIPTLPNCASTSMIVWRADLKRERLSLLIIQSRWIVSFVSIPPMNNAHCNPSNIEVE